MTLAMLVAVFISRDSARKTSAVNNKKANINGIVYRIGINAPGQNTFDVNNSSTTETKANSEIRPDSSIFRSPRSSKMRGVSRADIAKLQVPRTNSDLFLSSTYSSSLNKTATFSNSNENLCTPSLVMLKLVNDESFEKGNFSKEETLFESKPGLLLDYSTRQLYCHFGTLYANHLHAWGLYEQRTELTKMISLSWENRTKANEDYMIGLFCGTCNGRLERGQCRSCNISRELFCSICRIRVRGISTFCFECNHGGHADHMSSWFLDNLECPECGCKCQH